jgi:hypothetical protein
MGIKLDAFPRVQEAFEAAKARHGEQRAYMLLHGSNALLINFDVGQALRAQGDHALAVACDLSAAAIMKALIAQGITQEDVKTFGRFLIEDGETVVRELLKKLDDEGGDNAGS